jgi:hypothetical protein
VVVAAITAICRSYWTVHAGRTGNALVVGSFVIVGYTFTRTTACRSWLTGRARRTGNALVVGS